MKACHLKHANCGCVLCNYQAPREEDLQICPKLGSSISPVQVTIRPSVGIQSAVIVHDIDDIQSMPLANFIVIWVVRRSDLQGACAKLSVHVLICNDTDVPVTQPAHTFPATTHQLKSSKRCKSVTCALFPPFPFTLMAPAPPPGVPRPSPFLLTIHGRYLPAPWLAPSLDT